MDENTTEALPSSPPSFMSGSSEKVEAAQTAAQKAADKEQQAQDNDALSIRLAAVEKATGRLIEMAEYISRIDAVVSKTLPDFITAHPIGQVLDVFVQFEDAVGEVEKQYKAIAARVSYAREVSLPARLDADETSNFTSKDTGNRMTRTARVLASIISDPTGEILKRAYKWLRDNELGPLIKETVNSSSLSAAAKELMENGKELPDDLFKLHTKDGVSITRKKAK